MIFASAYPIVSQEHLAVCAKVSSQALLSFFFQASIRASGLYSSSSSHLDFFSLQVLTK